MYYKFVKKIIKDIRAEIGNGGLESSELNENIKEPYKRFSKFMNTDQNRKHKS